MKNNKNILIASLVFVILVMMVGYIAFAKKLSVQGKSTITGKWQVEITGIVPSTIGNAEAGDPSHTSSTASFNSAFVNAGDSVSYSVTVENKGTIDAKLNDIKLATDKITNDGQDNVVYEIINKPNKGDILSAGKAITLEIKATYNPVSKTNSSIEIRNFTAIIEYVQAN